MSGGFAYVLDLDPAVVNPELVDVAPVPADEVGRLRGIVERHRELTGSVVAESLLADWPAAIGRFNAIIARDYARVLEATRQAQAEGRDVNEAIMAAAKR
jgi:glutamate synthase (NADPH) large chain